MWIRTVRRGLAWFLAATSFAALVEIVFLSLGETQHSAGSPTAGASYDEFGIAEAAHQKSNPYKDNSSNIS